MISRSMAKKQHKIFKRQNESAMQQLIVAQHYTYTNAKHWCFILFCILVVFPIGINIALFFDLPDIVTGILALSSLVLLILGEIIRDYVQGQKQRAAMLQQKFDTYVFNIVNQYGIDENIIAEQLEKYKNKDWNRKKDWYQNYENMQDEKAVFYCQKENIDWTNAIGNKYCGFLLISLTVILLSFIVNFIIHNSSFIRVISIILAMVPLVSYGISSYKKIKHDNYELARINGFINEIDNYLNTMSEFDLKNRINVLQVMIYGFRQTKYLIPDWFENIYHKRRQAVEARKARNHIVADKKKKKKS